LVDLFHLTGYDSYVPVVHWLTAEMGCATKELYQRKSPSNFDIHHNTPRLHRVQNLTLPSELPNLQRLYRPSSETSIPSRLSLLVAQPVQHLCYLFPPRLPSISKPVTHRPELTCTILACYSYSSSADCTYYDLQLSNRSALTEPFSSLTIASACSHYQLLVMSSSLSLHDL
jgi:hypothetical protein